MVACCLFSKLTGSIRVRTERRGVGAADGRGSLGKKRRFIYQPKPKCDETGVSITIHASVVCMCVNYIVVLNWTSYYERRVSQLNHLYLHNARPICRGGSYRCRLGSRLTAAAGGLCTWRVGTGTGRSPSNCWSTGPTHRRETSTECRYDRPTVRPLLYIQQVVRSTWKIPGKFSQASVSSVTQLVEAS